MGANTPPMAVLTHRPYSAFALGWTYGPITLAQHHHAHRYANTMREPVATLPSYWIMPPRREA